VLSAVADDPAVPPKRWARPRDLGGRKTGGSARTLGREVRMSFLTRAARRLRGELMPAAPFASRDSIATRLFSLDDEPHQPSVELLDLAADLIHRAARIDLGGLAARTHMPAYLNVWPGEHYRLLAALVQALRPSSVVEIGTYTGAGSLALRELLTDGGVVATFDVDPWESLPHTCLSAEDFADGRLTQHVDDLADPAIARKHRDLLASAELIFMDGPHDGPTEVAMMRNLRSIPFAAPPILVFDDIKLPTMLKFWRELPYPKLDMTSFGHWSGTGIARWAP
jgi:predicted O-methyltransferase YrrM